MNTKNLSMLVILSAAMLTGLTATMTQATPVFADKLKCEDNGDNNCDTNKDHNVDQKNNCKIENENKDAKDDSTNANVPGDQTLICQTIAASDASLTVNQSPFNQLP